MSRPAKQLLIRARWIRGFVFFEPGFDPGVEWAQVGGFRGDGDRVGPFSGEVADREVRTNASEERDLVNFSAHDDRLPTRVSLASPRILPRIAGGQINFLSALTGFPNR